MERMIIISWWKFILWGHLLSMKNNFHGLWIRVYSCNHDIFMKKGCEIEKEKITAPYIYNKK